MWKWIRWIVRVTRVHAAGMHLSEDVLTALEKATTCDWTDYCAQRPMVGAVPIRHSMSFGKPTKA